LIILSGDRIRAQQKVNVSTLNLSDRFTISLKRLLSLPSLFDLIQFEDGGDPHRRQCLHQALEQLTQSPTGAGMAQDYLRQAPAPRSPLAGSRDKGHLR